MNLTRFACLRLIAGTALATLTLGAARADAGYAPTDAAPAKRQTKAEPDWTLAASKHNGSGIRLRYSVPAQLQPGQVARVQLQFSGVSADGASVDLRPPQGARLTRADGSALGTLALTRDQATTLDVLLTPAGDGMQTLDVFTSQAGRRSAQSVPLKVGTGAAALKASGAVKSTPAGERVISLPSTPER